MENHEQEYDNKINIGDDEISIEEESPDEMYVTINDIDKVSEMNMLIT